jgi:hypothetical protein
MSDVWYYRLGRVGSMAWLVGSACVLYLAIVGLGLWLTVSLYHESRSRAIFVAALSTVAAALWTRGLVSLYKRWASFHRE